jgi:very-short-patch-repair endonuclease
MILYGPDRPKFGLEQSPDGSMTIQVENDNLYSFDQPPRTVTWADVYDLRSKREDTQKELFHRFADNLLEMTGSKTEAKFLRLYLKAIKEGITEPVDQYEHSAWGYPALIPQVWVNWYHFDSKDKERAEKAREEPFRVDFALKDQRMGIGDRFAVIEIDGASHFGHYEVDAAGEVILESSMDAYTEHLKKDRWLRKKGWEVVRISSQEVDEIEDERDFMIFLDEILGRPKRVFEPEDLPF